MVSKKKKLILNPADNRDVLSNYFYRAILVFIEFKKKTGNGRRSENFVMKIISFINTIQVVFLGLTDLYSEVRRYLCQLSWGTANVSKFVSEKEQSDIFSSTNEYLHLRAMYLRLFCRSHQNYST